jgi:hypothetical protein
MLTIALVQSGSNYFVDGIHFGEDEEGLMLYLKAKGVPAEHITQALEGLAREGIYTIQQAS